MGNQYWFLSSYKRAELGWIGSKQKKKKKKELSRKKKKPTGCQWGRYSAVYEDVWVSATEPIRRSLRYPGLPPTICFAMDDKYWKNKSWRLSIPQAYISLLMHKCFCSASVGICTLYCANRLQKELETYSADEKWNRWCDSLFYS